MLFYALVPAAGLVVFANFVVHQRGHWFSNFWIVCAAAALACSSFFLTFLGMFFPPVVILAVALPLCMLPWYFTDRRPWLFLPLSIVAFVVAFVPSTWFALEERWHRDRLRAKFPFESLEERLAGARPEKLEGPLPKDVDDRLERLEVNLPGYGPAALRRLHNETISEFVESPGFGVTRMYGGTWFSRTPDDLVHEYPPAPQPLLFGPLSGADEKRLIAHAADPRHDLHRGSVVGFTHPEGWGYFKDRRHVSGFRPHRFTKLPDGKEWAVRRIELIGLLTHKRPVAYITANLPRMDEVKKAPTRPLDAFESCGLKKLRAGEDLVLGKSEERVRMVGALRAARQCAECHDCERGALLGAFSYWLRRAKPERDR
jgi:hypothetical protein